ncbi:MAG: VOC family protein [Gemmatimonadaceae bacterium]
MSSEIVKGGAGAGSPNFVWYEFHTADAAGAARFYSSVLGWGLHDAGMPDRSYTLVTVDNVQIGGTLQKPASSFAVGGKPAWIGYIGVSNVDAYVGRLQQLGGSVHRAAEDIPNVGRFAVVADPQGANFVLFQPSNADQQAERPMPGAPGSPAWHDLIAIDWQADFTFYADMFGWTKSDAVDMGPNGVYQVFACDGVPIGGMMNRMDPVQTPAWLYYFAVEEIGAAVDRVRQHGGTVTHGPAVVPGGQQVAQCLDPQGAIFALVGPEED